MVWPRCGALLVLVIPLCVTANPVYRVEIDNDLSRCIIVESAKVRIDQDRPTIEVTFKEISSTADCGCKSRLNAYSVYAIDKSHQSFLMGGKFAFNQSGSIRLPMAIDQEIVGNRPVRLTISCAQPE